MEKLPISPTTSLAKANRGDKKPDLDKLKKSCDEFESILIQQLLTSMRHAMVSPGNLGGTGGGLGKDIYLSLVDQEVSRSLAKRGGLGLGKIIYGRMVRQQDSSPAPLRDIRPMKREDSERIHR